MKNGAVTSFLEQLDQEQQQQQQSGRRRSHAGQHQQQQGDTSSPLETAGQRGLAEGVGGEGSGPGVEQQQPQHQQTQHPLCEDSRVDERLAEPGSSQGYQSECTEFKADKLVSHDSAKVRPKELCGDAV